MAELWGQAEPPAPHRQAWPPVYRCSCLWAPRIWPGHGAGTSCRGGTVAGTGEGLAPCSCTWRPPAGLLPHCGGRPTSRPGLGCFVR